MKWDGYRLAIHIEPGRKVRIITRGGHDWTTRFQTIAHDALELGLDSAILDGEAVVLDERGASDFSALQKALGGRGGKRFASEAILYAFDLLYHNGHDLRAAAHRAPGPAGKADRRSSWRHPAKRGDRRRGRRVHAAGLRDGARGNHRQAARTRPIAPAGVASG